MEFLYLFIYFLIIPPVIYMIMGLTEANRDTNVSSIGWFMYVVLMIPVGILSVPAIIQLVYVYPVKGVAEFFGM